MSCAGYKDLDLIAEISMQNNTIHIVDGDPGVRNATRIVLQMSG